MNSTEIKDSSSATIRKAIDSDSTDIDIILSTYFLDRDDIPYTRFYVAEKNGKIVGCAVYDKIKKMENGDEKFLFFEIHTIAVLPPHKGKGYGKVLLNKLLSEIETEIKVDENAEKILPDVYTRTTAPGFFIREGFVKTDIDKKKYWDECVQCNQIKNCSQTVLFKRIEK